MIDKAALEEVSVELNFLNKTTDDIVEKLKSLDIDGLNSISYNLSERIKEGVESVSVQTVVELTEKTEEIKKLTGSIERATKSVEKGNRRMQNVKLFTALQSAIYVSFFIAGYFFCTWVKGG